MCPLRAPAMTLERYATRRRLAQVASAVIAGVHSHAEPAAPDWIRIRIRLVAVGGPGPGWRGRAPGGVGGRAKTCFARSALTRVIGNTLCDIGRM